VSQDGLLRHGGEHLVALLRAEVAHGGEAGRLAGVGDEDRRGLAAGDVLHELERLVLVLGGSVQHHAPAAHHAAVPGALAATRHQGRVHDRGVLGQVGVLQHHLAGEQEALGQAAVLELGDGILFDRAGRVGIAGLGEVDHHLQHLARRRRVEEDAAALVLLAHPPERIVGVVLPHLDVEAVHGRDKEEACVQACLGGA